MYLPKDYQYVLYSKIGLCKSELGLTIEEIMIGKKIYPLKDRWIKFLSRYEI